MKMIKIKKYKTVIFLTLVCISGILIPACQDDFSGLRYDTDDKMQIYDYVRLRPDLSIYTEMADYSGFYGVLATAGDYTAFVPTDSAFRNLFLQLSAEGKPVTKVADREPEYWLKYLQYMTVDKPSLNTNTFQLGRLDNPTLLGENYYLIADIRNGFNAVKLNATATVKEANIKVANGLVDIIDAVLLPPTTSVYDMLDKTGKYKTMLKIFDDNGLTPYLKDSVITLIIEPDEVLEKNHFDRSKLENEADWAQYHIIFDYKHKDEDKARYFSGDLNGERITPMYNQEYLTFKVDKEDRMWVNDVYGFSQSASNGIDNVASNGIYHVLDTVLSIVEATPGKMTYNLCAKDNEEDEVVQNLFAETPANPYEDNGTYSFYRGKKAIAGVDLTQPGDIFWTTIPDVIKGKYKVNIVYPLGKRPNLTMIYNENIISSDVDIQNLPDGTWASYSSYRYKNMGTIEVNTRGDVKLIFQATLIRRELYECCDMMMDAIELIPVEE